jgi:hypothetical protein
MVGQSKKSPRPGAKFKREIPSMPMKTRAGKLLWRTKQANHGRKPAKSIPKPKFKRSSK